jgi:micrococcal nuclease
MGTGMRLIKIFLLLAIPLFLLSSHCYSQPTGTCKVTRIIDGDTIYCSDNGRRLDIRLIGIDAPESRANPKTYRDAERTGESVKAIEMMGKKSKAFVKSKLPNGTLVKLEYDVQKRDKYGRTLAYVYLPDGTMLNEVIVREGYAQVMTIPPDIKYRELFIKAERDARESNRGLWGDE